MASGKVPERLVTIANDSVWKIYDSGAKLSQGLSDYRVLWHAMCRYHEVYGYDAYNNYGNRNPFNFCEALGRNQYVIDDENWAFNVSDEFPMTEDDYPALIKKEYLKFILEDMIPRYYGYK